MNKKLREQVYQKYGGRCAYCGKEITLKQMQVDHIHPQYLGGNDDYDNLNPSCRVCNNWKLTHSVEQFRYEIEMQIDRLRLRSANFRMAERYGLVEITRKPVIFWFESNKPQQTHCAAQQQQDTQQAFVS